MRKKFMPITLSAVMVAGVIGFAGCSGGGKEKRGILV